MELRKTINRILALFLAFIMGLMTLNVLWQVFSRYVMDSPSSVTDELARYLMIWVGVLGAAYVAGQNKHVAIDIIPSRLSGKNQRVVKSIVNSLVILFALLAFIIGGIRLVYISFILGQQSPALQLPLAYVYMVIPMSGLLIIYYKISDFFIKKV